MCKRDKIKSFNRQRWGACRFLTFFLAFTSIFLAASIKVDAYSKEEYSLIDDNAKSILENFADIIPEGMEGVADPQTSSDSIGAAFLIECIVDAVNDGAGEITVFLTTLIGLSMLSSMSALKDGELSKAARGAVSIVCSAVIFDKVFFLVEEVGESLAQINGFYASVIPVITSVNAMGLSFSVASVQTVGMTLALQIYSFLSGDFLYSFVGALGALGALSSIDGSSFGRIGQNVKKAFLWVVGILTAFLGATFSLQSLISSYADSGVMRGAKYVVSGMIPIVGGSISAALSVLTSGFSYLKGAVGGGAIAVIVVFAVSPLVTLLLYRAAFGLAAFFSDICSQDTSSSLINSFSSAIDSLIAVYSLTVVIYIMQLVVFLRGGISLA